MNRREEREAAFSLIYETAVKKEESPEELFALACEERGLPEEGYIKTVFFGYIENLERIDKLISDNSIGWKENRISKVSFAIMRLCIYEMLYMDDIPYSVSMNEAVELAKKYDHDDAPAYINGVINAVAEKEGIK